MMLRESVQHADETFDLSALSGREDAEGTVPHQGLLMDFTEAVVLKDADCAADLRPRLVEALGVSGFLDACGVIAGFHGFTRVADSAGVPVDGRYVEEAGAIQDQTGVSQYSPA